jgi:hypothetical protein
MDRVVGLVTVMIVFAVPGMIVLALGLLFKRRSVVVLGGVMIVLLAFVALSTYWWSSGSETIEQTAAGSQSARMLSTTG